MSQYQNGTVSVTNNNNVVTGSGTLWLANISTGDLFTKEGDNVAYTVASIPSNTQITLTGNYGGSSSSGSSYGITIDFTSEGYPLLSDGDLNTAAIYNEFARLVSNANIWSDNNVEYGTNVNGEFWKYPDGRQVCMHTIVTAAGTPASLGAVFQLSVGGWTLPNSFIDANYVVEAFTQYVAGADPISVSNLGGASNTATDIATLNVIYAQGTAGSSTRVFLTAIGRWK